jgi:hypothetical protein
VMIDLRCGKRVRVRNGTRTACVEAARRQIKVE